MSYRGDISPNEAWEILKSNGDARLVDVRTGPEWAFVGTPDLSELGRDALYLSWQVFPTMARNPTFESELAKAEPGKDNPLLFLCRSGGRSAAAASAMTAAGYGQAYNIEGGFEGDKDCHGHRGAVNGWKAAELPWVQG